MVMDASTYLCEVHDKAYYWKVKLKDIAGQQDTFRAADVVDYYKGVVRPAPYKNLTFRCKILSMNPQLQTVNMSDLLVVLKDFTEEWQGEIDSSPTELALMFSVVGENPQAELNLTGNSREKAKNAKINKAEKDGSKWLQYSAGKVISL
jgi:Ran GTPase-activating protein (RanGAP) involved in mRNA processing and transport